ncbi:MAG: LLM class flavin-dependent oxidoreductase, partial [Angustibacter sp.]
MKWGMLLATAKPENRTESEVITATVAHAKSADRWGYDSAWVLEHHFTSYALNPDTFTLAGLLLGATDNLHVGTAVTIAPFVHPVRIAESTALLDLASGGRFHLGLGRGICPADFEVFRVDSSTTHGQIQECADVLVRAWTEEKVRGDGE